ncbi:Arc family DNA-binding protein [Halomonas sabkhae]|uniref:FitA-like ribbon-helix-helix domain-containing protein n=1 Tax=Halomonas sabkhae TaxID=626223 RepID=UPI0025B3592D|nr:Arc family DNA-binding protein [Halomonas sabkhae]MDN3525313.1 Arc family DNA-binding protein [Halomonas sabkhae]
MGMMTVRNIPDEVHNALKARAKRHHRSAEAEVRAILEEAIRPEARLHMGDALAALGRKVGMTNEDLDALEQERDKTPAEPVTFE